ncbi:vacuolar protein sorting-associated protein 45 [Pancytospora philotis]|nr:vacuolar protein sorting-associated protein 45 [Pancytospora philotis]
MDLVFKRQFDFILSRGQGAKACLFDHETKQLISNVIPYSRFQDHDYFYFDLIENKNRVPISDISCVVVLRAENLRLLIEELSSPFYGSYCVLFTNQIDPFALEILANADTKCVVREVHEIFLDLARQSSFLYTVGSTRHRRVADGLYSLLMSLEIAPVIKHMDEGPAESGERLRLDAGSELDASAPSRPGSSLVLLAKELGARVLQHNFRRQGTVLLLRRSFDMVTPLLYDWHYQALIKEHLDYDNSVVRTGGKEYGVSDAFFEANKFSDIHSVGASVKAMIQVLERNRVKISNHEFEDIEEKAAHSLMVETHLSIYNAVLEKCMRNKDGCEMEMAALRGAVPNLEQCAGVLSEQQQLKLLLLYFTRHVKDWEEESQRYPRLRDALLHFLDRCAPLDYPYKPILNSAVDVKLGYEPPIKKIVKHAILNKLRQGAFVGPSAEGTDTAPIIVYIEGGITMCEYREVMKYAAEIKREVYLVADRIITYKDILNLILK